MWRDPWISWVFAHDILYCTMQNHACLYCMCIYATNKSCSVSYICIYPEYLNGHAMEISWNIMDDLFILCYPNIVPTKINMWFKTAAASWVFWFEDQSNPCPICVQARHHLYICAYDETQSVVRMMLDCIGVKAPRRYLIHGISWDHIGTIWLWLRHGFSMAQIEIDGLPMKIAWWIFPWRTVSHKFGGGPSINQWEGLISTLQTWLDNPPKDSQKPPISQLQSASLP